VIIYLVRHADAISSSELSDREKNDLGLTDFGKSEAHAVGKILKNKKIRRIISSPIRRAVETAEIISSCTGVLPVFDDRLREFSPDLDSIDTELVKNLKKDARSNPNKRMPSGESFDEAVKRFEDYILSFGNVTNDAVCAVSHRVVIEGFLNKNFGIEKEKHEWLRNASITKLQVDGKNIKLIFFDRRYRDLNLIWKTLKRKFFLN
jgi:broad specificity phosphatase PhoE